MVRLGFHNAAGNTRRVEIWYLTAPATGAQNAVVTVNLPGGGGRVGVVAGVMSFRGVDQTTPLSGMVSNDGANGTVVQLDIPSGTSQIVFDTLSALSTAGFTVTPGPSQTVQWDVSSNTTSGGDVRGFGSTNV